MSARKVYKEEKYNCIRYSIENDTEYDNKCMKEITAQIEKDHEGLMDPDKDEYWLSYQDTKLLEQIFKYYIDRLRLCCGKFPRKKPIYISYDFCYREEEEIKEYRRGNQNGKLRYILIVERHLVFMYPRIFKRPDHDNIYLTKLNN